MVVLPLLMVATALANTETVLFDYDGGLAAGTLAPLEAYSSEFEFASDVQSETLSLPLKASAGKYLARVCWPASHAADLSIKFDESTNALVIEGSKEHIVALRGGVSPAVQFDVHLSPLKFGIVPVDVLPAIQSTVVTSLSVIAMTCTLLKYI